MTTTNTPREVFCLKGQEMHEQLLNRERDGMNKNLGKLKQLGKICEF